MSVSDSIIDGSLYGFCVEENVRSIGDVMPPRVRSSADKLEPFFSGGAEIDTLQITALLLSKPSTNFLNSASQ